MRFVELARDHAPQRAELAAAFQDVLERSAFILGEDVASFEREFAAYCGVQHCVGVASGTAALTLAMIAAGVPRGSEVIVPAHTYIASALAVVHAGAKPVFCDVDEATGLLDIASARAAISERTSAIVIVHLYGQILDIEPIRALAQQHGLAVIEDAAQAHGASRQGRRPGQGAVAAFSFYPSKNLGALGDGGAVCTDNGETAARVRELRHLGQRRRGEHAVAGFNERLDGMQAAMLRIKLRTLDDANGRRREHAAAYRAGLSPASRPLADDPRAQCVYHLFPIRVRDRTAVRAALDRRGIDTGIHYSPPLHRQPPFAGLSRSVSLNHAEHWAAEELSLPIYPGLKPAECQRVIAAVNDTLEAQGMSP